jgi:hypothetical protein
MTRSDLPSEIYRSIPYTWLMLAELILINSLIYAQLRASGLSETVSYIIVIFSLLTSILIPHFIAPRPAQYQRRLSLVHYYVIPILVIVWLGALLMSVNADRNAASIVIRVLTAIFVAPVFFILLIFPNVVLIARASNRVSKLRSLFGAIAGVLLGLIIILLLMQAIPRSAMANVLIFPTIPIVVMVFSVLGYLAVLLLDNLLRKGAVSFINLTAAATSIVSAYLLMWSSALFFVFAVGFLVGNAIYFMMTPAVITHLTSFDKDKE